MMFKNHIFKKFPKFENELGYVKLIQEPTPVEKLTRLTNIFNHTDLYIKREDQTAQDYGGNKIRNLEFVLGDAIKHNHQRVITLVPFGSNFTGALSAQSRKLGIQVNLSQFNVFRNPQIEAHAEFSEYYGAQLRTYYGKLGPVRAALNVAKELVDAKLEHRNLYHIAPGASSLLGALGHTNALLELQTQINEGQIPEPDYLIVGAGTCGTIAGLTAGIKIAGLKTKIIGVRCAEKIVCNRSRIASLANQVLIHLEAIQRVTIKEVDLRESPENIGYAVPTSGAKDLMNLFFEFEGVQLDTTYTAKVALFLQEQLYHQEFQNKKILYWHTFSPSALLHSQKILKGKIYESVS
jgi:1-aminocyclopropane-1-carboxylate deaminase/D-cysteine desulfhydrase-like pyridoxal-dependent ACC family enzyme